MMTGTGQKGKVNTKVLDDLILKCQEQNRARNVTAGEEKIWFTVLKRALEDEMSRSVDFLNKLQLEILNYAKSLLQEIDSAKASLHADSLGSVMRSADSVVDAILHMKQLEQENRKALLQIADLADSTLSNEYTEGVSCRCLCDRQFADESKNQKAFSDLVIFTSDIYAAIRDLQCTSESNKTWEAPASFERSTNKYWVHDERLIALLVKCAKEAPLLVYGKSGRLSSHVDKEESSSPLVAKDSLWTEVASHITSVYFDSPRMDMYKERIARHEGAQLFRIRWYGSRRPTGEEPVFLELKTHHEKWVDVKSVKERVTIQERDVMTFLSPGEWTEREAERLILAGSAKLKGEALEKAKDLIMTMHRLVVEKNLRPCVRSTYYRLAFQSPESNSLRLTLDRNVTLIDERSAYPQSWCLPDETILKRSMLVRVPYSVFEVKLAGSDTPEFIEKMKESEVILDAAKFSKFLTGAAAFNSHVIQTLPYWAEDPSFATLFQGLALVEENAVASVDSSGCENNSNFLAGGSIPRFVPVGDTSTEESTKAPSSVENSYSSKDKKEPCWYSWWNCARSSSPSKIIAAKRPARVEPKSYFANERTFIQWISASLLLVTIAVIMLDFQSSNMHSLNVGMALLCSAACMVVYSIFVYHRRLQLLASGSSYGYVDRMGPILLAVAVLVGLVILAVYFIEQHQVTSGLRGGKVIVSDNDECYQHNLQGISMLEYQPSDIVYDQKRNLFLVPSLAQITGIPADGSDVLELVKIHGMDFEAITYAGSRIFAISEDSAHSHLVELKWDNLEDNKLVEMQRWKIPSQHAEGIAFVPSADGPDRLYVAGDDKTAADAVSRVTLSFYEIPEESASLTSEVLNPVGRLNENLLNEGLVDSKVTAMTFFENVLYLLHDNAQLVRAWDIATGNLLAEWPLPRIRGGFNKQWEGIVIERRAPTDERKFRFRSNKKEDELVVHLTLDTPPQVWSIRVRQGGKRGEIVFPSCAGI